MKKFFVPFAILVALSACTSTEEKLAGELCACEDAYASKMVNADDSLIKVLDERGITTDIGIEKSYVFVFGPIEEEHNKCLDAVKEKIKEQLNTLSDDKAKQVFEDSLYSAYDRCAQSSLSLIKKGTQNPELQKRVDYIRQNHMAYPYKEMEEMNKPKE